MMFHHWLMREFPSKPKIIEIIARYLIGIGILVFFFIIIFLIILYPHWPTDVIGWCILIFFGIPLMVLKDFIGEFIHDRASENPPKKISNKKAIITFSLLGGILLFIVLSFLYFDWITPHFQ